MENPVATPRWKEGKQFVTWVKGDTLHRHCLCLGSREPVVSRAVLIALCSSSETEQLPYQTVMGKLVRMLLMVQWQKFIKIQGDRWILLNLLLFWR